MKIPRKEKKKFKNWLRGVRSISLNPFQKPDKDLVLMDLYILFKRHNMCKTLYKAQ